MQDIFNILANNGLAIFLVIYWSFNLSKKFDAMNENLTKILENIIKHERS